MNSKTKALKKTDNDNKKSKDCNLAFKPIFHFLTSEQKRRFSEVSGTFVYKALKMDIYTHIWPMFCFS